MLLSENMEENSDNKSQIAKREEKILAYWQENNTFRKSLEKEAPKGNYVFYDGPPFATGLPHYGHILGSTAKDVIGRYQTMQGFKVPRKWGWDCHGLPIEHIIEKELKISGHKEIEEYGIEKFTEYARSKVLTYVHDWKRTVDRIGRWVDFDNGYKTMDNTFIESVWWALGELNKKSLVYEGVRVLAYCPRCETPIANSEIAMDNSYKDITDISVFVKFPLIEDPNTYLVAWTTTPWSLPGDTALAVNKEIKYIKILHEGAYYVIAKERAPFVPVLKDIALVEGENYEEVNVEDLIGKSYIPPFKYYENTEMPNKENIWKIWHADFVTIDAGTGIAHEAPAFGEEDMDLAKKNNIPFINHVTVDGKFASEVLDFAGEKIKPKEDHQSGDVLIIKYLAKAGTLFAKEKIIHSYPHCYRCETPLFYYALPSWFVNVQKVKNKMLENAKEMNWIPGHLKEGRFQNIMENAPDWNISRNRYWASPLPIWKSESGKLLFVSSVEDLKNKTKKSGNKYFIMRHGESTHNTEGICSSVVDYPHHLTEEGKKIVGENAELLKTKNITTIYCSPYVRTKETAEIVANTIGFDKTKIIYDERIEEFKFGDFNMKPMKEYLKWREKVGNTVNLCPPNGESVVDSRHRFSKFYYDIDEKLTNQNVLVISHGIALEVMEGIDNGYSDEIMWKNWKMNSVAPGHFKEFNFTPLPHNKNFELDLHRPYIDNIVLTDGAEEYHRVPEVMDCWFESGSMPFAQDHYPFDFAQGKPFEGVDWKKLNFPAGFVAEYIAQTRTWFYYSHTLSTMLFDHAPFKNVVTTGTLLASDGQKMSKSKGNYPDPWIIFNKFGVDPLRFYLMSSPLMKGEDTNFMEKSVQDISSKIISRMDNVVAFYELYRDNELENKLVNSKNVLDIWILARLEQCVSEVTAGMEAYDMALASRPFELFIEDLSTWYLRRSRERIKDGDAGAKATLYFVLKTVATIIAPLTPFLAEDIWQKLKLDNDPESVHLTTWPLGRTVLASDVVKEMQNTRDLVSLGLQARQKTGIPVRQPLQKLKVKSIKLNEDYIELIKEELNVKEVVEDIKIENTVELDTEITPELKREGDYRELVRAVQELRKNSGLTPSDIIVLTMPLNTKEIVAGFEDDMKKTVLATEILFEGEEMKVVVK